MKKLVTIMVVVFAFAMTMNVAFAYQSNSAFGVNNGISATAVSGGNSISGLYVGSGTIVAGTSVAKAKGISAVNTNVKVGYGMESQANNAFGVGNGIEAAGASGDNEITGAIVNGGTIRTDTSVAKAKGITLLNTNVKFGFGF